MTESRVAEEKKDVRRSYRTMTFPVIAVAGCLIVTVVVFCAWKIQDCEKNCTYVHNEELETYVNELQTNVTREETEDGVKLSVKGYLNEITYEDQRYFFVFNNFFERAQVNGKTPAYMFSVSSVSCGDQCKSTVEKLKERRKVLQNNELTTLTLISTLKELSFSDKINLLIQKLVASFGDYRIDVSAFAETQLWFTTMNASELEESCSNSVNSNRIPELGVALYDSLIEVLSNKVMIQKESSKGFIENTDSIAQLLRRYGWFNCNTCSGECEGDNSWGVGLDYLFFPMVVALMNDNNADIDPSVALELLSLAYDDTFETFEDFIKSENHRLESLTDLTWANESLCLPYFLVSDRAADSQGNFYQVARRICYDRGAQAMSLMQPSFSDDVYSRYSDERILDQMELLLQDYDSFVASNPLEGQPPADGLIWPGIDDMIYGYEKNNAQYVSIGNREILSSFWYLNQVFEVTPMDSDRFTSHKFFRELILALQIKEQYEKDPARISRIESLIEMLVEKSGNASYAERAYDILGEDIVSTFDTVEVYRGNLGDQLSLYLVNPVFATAKAGLAFPDLIDQWFINRYSSEECGKADKGYFVGYDSDGDCIQEYVGIRSSITTLIYLTLYFDEKQ